MSEDRRGPCTGGCGRTISWYDEMCPACEAEDEARQEVQSECEDNRCACGACLLARCEYEDCPGGDCQCSPCACCGETRTPEDLDAAEHCPDCEDACQDCHAKQCECDDACTCGQSACVECAKEADDGTAAQG